MSINDILKVKTVPFSETKAGKKALKRETRVSDTLDTLRNGINSTFAENETATKQGLYIESAAKNLSNPRSARVRAEARNRTNFINQITRTAVCGYLTEMTFQGLVFDKQFLADYHISLRENISKVFYEAYDKKYISPELFLTSESVLMKQTMLQIKEAVNNLYDKRSSMILSEENVVSYILQESDVAASTAEEIGEIVKDKVIKTLTNEKRIANDQQEDEKQAAALVDNMGDEQGKTDDLTPDQPLDGSNPNEQEVTMDEPVQMQDPNQQTNTDPNQQAQQPDMGQDQQGIETENPDNEMQLDGNTDLNTDLNTDDTQQPADQTTQPQPMDGNSLDTQGKPININIKNGEQQISITTLKSESGETFQIFGPSVYKQRNRNTIFRNIFETCLKEEVNHKRNLLLNESYKSKIKPKIQISMDKILGEAVVNYTILETLYTSKLFNLTQEQIMSLRKKLNFER